MDLQCLGRTLQYGISLLAPQFQPWSNILDKCHMNAGNEKLICPHFKNISAHNFLFGFMTDTMFISTDVKDNASKLLVHWQSSQV